MSCKAAIADKLVTLSPDESVDDALKTLKKSKVETLPVVDNGGRMLGVFSLQVLMKNLLPVNVPISGGLQMDVKIGAAPGIAKRLNKVHVLQVSDLMDKRASVIDPAAPIWEAVNILVEQGAPLFVVDAGSQKVLGMITHQSMLDELHKMKDSDT